MVGDVLVCVVVSQQLIYRLSDGSYEGMGTLGVG